jgi:ribosomal protein L4
VTNAWLVSRGFRVKEEKTKNQPSKLKTMDVYDDKEMAVGWPHVISGTLKKSSRALKRMVLK